MSRKRMTRRRRQQRGGGFSYDGPAGVSASGVPFDTRATYDHCYGDMRAAPAVTPVGAMRGGRRRQSRRGQRGGCGCMASVPIQAGGGGGTGGYGFDLTSHAMGKDYAALTVGACPQKGGAVPSAAEAYGAVSYPAGYGFDTSSAYSTPSAHFLEPMGYDRSCKGGARRRHKRKHSHKRK
jgi:hypothetical protein